MAVATTPKSAGVSNLAKIRNIKGDAVREATCIKASHLMEPTARWITDSGEVKVSSRYHREKGCQTKIEVQEHAETATQF